MKQTKTYTKDLQQLKVHLVNCRKESMEILAKDNGNVEAWRDLCSSVLASLVLQNRRREGEASKLLVKHKRIH